MPRIRTLKPEHRQHRKIGPLSDRAYRLWVSMILEADDQGRLVCDAAQLRAVTWPYHAKIHEAHVEAALSELAKVGLIRVYESEGVRYADFPSWKDHQRIDHPAKPKLPEFAGTSTILANPRESSRILANDPGGSEGKGSEGTEGSGSEAREGSRATSATPAENGFRIPPSILQALDKSPRLGAEQRLRDRAWWQAEIRANTGVDMAHEVLKAEAYLASHPERHYKRLGSFLHNWLGRAEREPETDRDE